MNDDEKSFAKLYESGALVTEDDDVDIPWLEMAWDNKSDKIVKYVLERKFDELELCYIKHIEGNNSKNIQLWKEVLLSKCIRDNHQEGFQMICSPMIVNGERRIISCSYLELAAEHGSCTFVPEILKKSIFNSEIWERAKQIAVEKNQLQIHESILNREFLLKYREKANLSILHTSVCDNDPDMVEYILKKKNPTLYCHNHEILGTAFALAIGLCHKKCIKVLEQFHVNFDTQNMYFQSPLHEAILNGMIDHCGYLIDRVHDVDEAGFMGQTALHSAVIKGCEDLCNQLVEKGADCNKYMEFLQRKVISSPLSKRENSLTLCLKINQTIYPCFLKILDSKKANSSDDEGNTLLHFSIKLLNTDLCKTLIQAGGNLDAVNSRSKTPLSELLSSLNLQTFNENEDKVIEIVNLFVQSGCNLKMVLAEDLTLFQIAVKFNCERLLLALVPSQGSELFEVNESLFKISLEKGFLRFSETLLNLFGKSQLKPSISTDIIEMAIRTDCPHLLKSFIINASDSIQQIVLEFSLYHLAKLDATETFESLLRIEINDPQCFENGETLLTRLLKERKNVSCLKIIESVKHKNKYINLKNRNNQTPLQVAIETELLDIVPHLIFETDNLDNEDCEGRTVLMQLFLKISDNEKKHQHTEFLAVIKAIIFGGGNIYHKSSKSGKILQFCSELSRRNEIELLFKNNQNKLSRFVSERIVEKERIIEKEKIIVVKESGLEKIICGICLDRDIDSVLDCGHTICQLCSDKIVRCPFCNLAPVQPKRIFFN